MTLVRSVKSVRLSMLGLMLLLMCATMAARAQQGDAPAAALSTAVVEENTNLDVELYLITASDAATAEGGKMPNALEPVVRRLRSSLPFTNYRLTATMLNRVKNGGNLNVKGIGGTPFPKAFAPAPLFSEYSVNGVRLKADAAGQMIVELSGFRFGARVPIQTGTARTDSAPVIHYEHTGITTEFSMRESEPVVVGTLNVGQTGEVFILVVAAKRTAQR